MIGVLTGAPLIPDGDEARRWAEQELSDPSYLAAQPTPIDRIAQAVGDAIARFFSQPLTGSWGPVAAVVATVIVLAVVLVAFLVWGRPRSRARMRTTTPSDLFGDAAGRSAQDLRADAARWAASGDWSAAVSDAVRALARGLDERGIVTTPPGATVQAFARAATASFPDRAADLARCAADFDDVRYLRRPGSRETYDRVRALDDRLAHARATVDAR
ncbi:DUF4129 domain-containing protein [Microbacterium sp. cx-55]|uniref:DUF4129 domain-containing protein n=1 Tax=Microbacterium sp. cx-55 TaxID=2875948 RepID=UPI001CBE43EC|nr:DUF4129 domain-containing protein [Microbacterium sp. cx-55]MBZ4488736.1 DUF4129 domain-containing protein [Microbacterium sp. cx-55]UGB36029.1 DUF4129 domain-containing protein [Microbacterium sp. cx-55]